MDFCATTLGKGQRANGFDWGKLVSCGSRNFGLMPIKSDNVANGLLVDGLEK